MTGKLNTVLSLLIAVAVVPGSICAQKNFNMYGFMDVNVGKMFLEENNFFQTMDFITPEPRLLLGNVNLYFDFTPNNKTRALIELAVNSTTYDDVPTLGRDLSVSSEAEMQLYQAAYLGAIQQGADEATAAATASATVEAAQAGLSGANMEYRSGKKYGGIKLERAWFDIKANDQLNFRIGRFLTPAGIWNVDHGSPLILTIGQPNQWNMVPIFPNAQNGVMVHGRTYLGDHDLDYKVYLSSGRDGDNLNNPTTKELADFGVGGHAGINLDIFSGISIGVSGYTGKIKKTRLMQEYEFASAAEVMSRTTSLDGFTFKRYEDQVAREIDAGIDFKASIHKILLQMEYNHQRDQNQLSDDAVTPVNGFYVLAGYDIGIRPQLGVTPYFFFESLKWKDAQLNPAKDLYMFPFNGWNQITGGLNIRLFSNIRWKIEYSTALMEVINKPYNPGVDPSSSSFDNLSDTQKYNSFLANGYGNDDLNIHTIRSQIAIAF